MILLIAAVVIPLLLVGMAAGVVGLVVITPALWFRHWRQQRRAVRGRDKQRVVVSGPSPIVSLHGT
ncbi:MAG: hypothetical protein ACRDL5_18980 [Solirubrobacteraceae bacterium]